MFLLTSTGDFRFDHVRVRTCAESIAIYDGGEREKIQTEKTFFELLRNQMRIMRWHWGLNGRAYGDCTNCISE